jgi:hypothetical protein
MHFAKASAVGECLNNRSLERAGTALYPVRAQAWRHPLVTWYLRHHRDDRPVETIRCGDLQKARRMCRDLQEVGENAWIENERGLKLQLWDFWDP